MHTDVKASDKQKIQCTHKIVIIIIFINCNWVVTRWQWLFITSTKHEIGLLLNLRREKHVVVTWNLGSHLSICSKTQGNQGKPVSEVAGRRTKCTMYNVQNIRALCYEEIIRKFCNERDLNFPVNER
jgi:hypothetical protein